MKDFFGFGGYDRPVEGFLSWQHLVFVSVMMVIMVFLAIALGRRDLRRKNLPLVWAAILIDGIELFKIIIMCIRGQDAMHWIYELPLFLCSIQLVTIPLAAFSKGKLRKAALDFVAVFGLLGAVSGTYGAGNIYSCYPVLSFDTVVSAVTHSISGFAALYILICGLAELKWRNMGSTFLILGVFSVCAYGVNHLIDYNYMFLMRGDGTPYEILYSLVGGDRVLYPLGVVAMFGAYILLFYYLFNKCRRVDKTAGTNL